VNRVVAWTAWSRDRPPQWSGPESLSPVLSRLILAPGGWRMCRGKVGFRGQDRERNERWIGGKFFVPVIEELYGVRESDHNPLEKAGSPLTGTITGSVTFASGSVAGQAIPMEPF